MDNLLEGEVLDPHVQECEQLRADIRRLRRELADAQVEAERAREDANRALSMLRRQLSPLYRALQAVFGELDAAGVGNGPEPMTPESPKASGPDTRVMAVWESWKQKLGGKPAEFIDILLQHGEMTAAQLRIAARCSSDTVYQTIYKLNKAGLLNKNGGRFSLKQL